MPELATFALFAYRQEAFVAEAIRAVARQAYCPMELMVNEDASTDASRAGLVLHAVGNGERYVH